MIRKVLPLWVWAGIAIFFFMVTVGGSASFCIYYVHSYASNQCDALNLLISPHTQIHNAVFREALVRWARADGCRLCLR